MVARVPVCGLILIPIGMVIERRRRFAMWVCRPTFRGWTSTILPNAARRVRSGLRSDVLAGECSRQLQGVRVHRLGGFSAGSYVTPSCIPSFVAYEASPHARVACVDCHVGSGASWYVKSKLSGLRQVTTRFGHVSAPHPHPGAEPSPRAANLRTMPLRRNSGGAQLKGLYPLRDR